MEDLIPSSRNVVHCQFNWQTEHFYFLLWNVKLWKNSRLLKCCTAVVHAANVCSIVRLYLKLKWKKEQLMEPRIWKFVNDVTFTSTLNDVERLAWNAFIQVVKKLMEKCNIFILKILSKIFWRCWDFLDITRVWGYATCIHILTTSKTTEEGSFRKTSWKLSPKTFK